MCRSLLSLVLALAIGGCVSSDVVPGGAAGRDSGVGGAGSGGQGGGGSGGSGGAGGAQADAPPKDASETDLPRAADAGPPAGSDGSVRFDAGGGFEVRTLPAPPATWQEHWFDHVQLLQLVDYNDDVAIYFDDDVVRTGTGWLLTFLTQTWRYTRATYGELKNATSDGRVYTIFHQNKYSGGHPSTYFDASHDLRNVTDCGPGPWQNSNDVDLASHEVGHVVEGANNASHGSPAFPLWGDSKWMEFYQYDLYVALGMDAHAQRVFTKFTNTTDSFPRAGTRWFRDWFYPLWRDHGHVDVMVRFFKLLAQHFPKNGSSYARNLNWGEFIHFMSGAARTNLKAMANTAFGPNFPTEAQFNAARTAFPLITY